MKDWFHDPRAATGEIKSFEAERHERAGRFDAARALYREAGESYASVAINVPTDCPNMRGDLAIAAVACFARAGEFDRAVELAHRFLAEPDGVSKRGYRELTDMVRAYAELIAPKPFPTRRRVSSVREQVRRSFSSHPEAA